MSEWVQVPAGIHLLTAVLFSVWSATVRLRADTVMSLESSRLFNLIMTPLKLFCQVVPEDSCSSLSALRFAENWRLDSGSPGLQLILLSPHALKNTLHTAVYQFNYGGKNRKQTNRKETPLIFGVFFWRALVHLWIFRSFFFPEVDSVTSTSCLAVND